MGVPPTIIRCCEELTWDLKIEDSIMTQESDAYKVDEYACVDDSMY